MTIASKGDTVTYGDTGAVQRDADLVVSTGAIVKTVTLVTDTSIYADNDVLAVPQEITSVFPSAGALLKLSSVVLLDQADQGVDIELLFFNADATLGTINLAVSISDADAQKILASVLLEAANYSDLINSQLVAKNGIGAIMAGATTSLWIGAVVRSGTPTFAADSLVLKLAFERC